MGKALKAGIFLGIWMAFIRLFPPQPMAVPFMGPFNKGFNKDVVSLREMRYHKVIPQRFDFSCGAASMATLLKYYYGLNTSEEEIVKTMINMGDKEKIKKEGFSLLDLKRYATQKGFVANGYKMKPEHLPKLKIPTIVLINTRGYSHFVVLKGIKGNEVYLSDPSIGNRSLPLDEFLQEWNGVIFVVYKEAPVTPLPLETRPKAPVKQVPYRGIMDWSVTWGTFRPQGEF